MISIVNSNNLRIKFLNKLLIQYILYYNFIIASTNELVVITYNTINQCFSTTMSQYTSIVRYKLIGIVKYIN